jgi:hypothetical protein
MTFQVITQEQYQELLTKLDILGKQLATKQKDPKEVIFDSQELMQLLNIGKSTLQKLRDDGHIGFSQVNGKFYYRQFDINEMIEKNYKPPFR